MGRLQARLRAAPRRVDGGGPLDRNRPGSLRGAGGAAETGRASQMARALLPSIVLKYILTHNATPGVRKNEPGVPPARRARTGLPRSRENLASVGAGSGKPTSRRCLGGPGRLHRPRSYVLVAG